MSKRRFASPAAVVVIAILACLAAVVPSAWAQEQEPVKTEANLVAPAGSTSGVTGKAKATYQVKQNGTSEKLYVTVQHVQRRTSYRLAVNGIDLGVFEPKGNSGTLKLQLRRPVKGRQSGIPDTIPPVNLLTTIDVYDAVSGELVATGLFQPVAED
jgi:hypothetical protein